MAKFSLKSYHKPTPEKFAKIGKTLLAVGTSISSTALISALNADSEKVQKLLYVASIISMGCGALGAIFLNFFADDSPSE